ncbi:hypothetical protein HanXRQr2_Chr13g0566631 [Helianthus annuus]|uniref:Uncharacterized protein n=1 Tax=Helianthus annuus TaxID=4232 RepID=A0A9K3H8H6_HELAN|nr:hypothetical protein HanXRQr2_Chr13g0566631 [Helianthus annuus]
MGIGVGKAKSTIQHQLCSALIPIVWQFNFRTHTFLMCYWRSLFPLFFRTPTVPIANIYNEDGASLIV